MRAGAVTGVWLMGSFWHIPVIVPFLSLFGKVYPTMLELSCFQ
jgi:hypothetical protein